MRLVFSIFFLAALALIAAATLTPSAQAQPSAGLCVFCGDLGGTDFILNMVLFVPLGMALAGLVRSVWWGVLGSAVTSFTIEVLQFRVVSGRDASLGDLIANTTGAVIGVLIVHHARSLVLPNARRARALAMAAGGVVITILVATARLLQPSVPYNVFWVQYTPVRQGYDVFAGTLDSLFVNARPLRPAQAVDPLLEPHVVLADRNDVRAVVHAGPPTRDIAPIARIASPSAEHFMLGRDGNALVYRTRMAAADLLLRAPIAALDDAFAGVGEGDNAVVELGAGLDGYYLRLSARGPDGSKVRRVPLSAALFWTLVAPRNVPLGDWYVRANAAFLALLTLPVFYWTAIAAAPRRDRQATRRARFKAAVIAGVVVVFMSAAPVLAGAAPLAPPEWAGVVLSALLGALLARLATAYRQRTAQGEMLLVRESS